MAQRRAVYAAVAEARRRGFVTIAAAGVLVLLVAVAPATSASAGTSVSERNAPAGALLTTLADPGATSGDFFGLKEVALAGTTAVVGAPLGDSGPGAVYIYQKGAAGWPSTPTATLPDPQATEGDLFGLSVAVSVSGTTVIVGAPGAKSSQGVAYIYVKGASGWSTKPTIKLPDPAATAGDEFGSSVGVTRWSSLTALVGAIGTNSDAGAAYIYVKGASGWSKTPTAALPDPGATADDQFGESVAVAGRTAVVGAEGSNSFAGAAYMYVNGPSGWPTTPTATVSDPAATPGDYFGYSVAVTVAGPTVIVGAALAGSSTGAAYIYSDSASGWPMLPTASLSDPTATSGDTFGGSVSIQGPTAVVGAPGAYSDTGAAYIYSDGASGWPAAPTTTLSDPGATAGDEYGFVAVWKKIAVVGAPGTNSNEGTAYVYKA